MSVREERRFVRRDFGDDRADVVEREREAFQPRGVEPAEDPDDKIVAEDLDVAQDLAAAVADPNEDDAPVLGMANALDEAVLLHPVDEAGGVRIGDAEELGDPAHGQLAVAIEHRHEVEMTHRHAVSNEPLAAHAAQLAERGAKLGDDVGDERRSARVWLISSRHTNYSIEADDVVNMEDCR
jgi:hypothetical protein